MRDDQLQNAEAGARTSALLDGGLEAEAPSTPAQATATGADYALYEARKAEWIAQHPGASAELYQAAIGAIAAACGV